jgi:hypothetical protein
MVLVSQSTYPTTDGYGFNEHEQASNGEFDSNGRLILIGNFMPCLTSRVVLVAPIGKL